VTTIAQALAALARAIGRLQARIGKRRLRTLTLGLEAGFVVALVVFAVVRSMDVRFDAHAYWSVDLANPYSRAVASQDAFTYPPPAAIVFWILGHLPWEVFMGLWTVVIGLALLWMAGPWSLFLLALPPVYSDLYLGNIHILLAAAIVGGFRRPALWAFPLLTKPSVGIGLLWFAIRREWRPLAIALGVAAALSLAAAVLQPALWPAWIEYILRTGVSPDVGTAAYLPIPLLIRVPVGVLLVAWGARSNRAWMVPIASTLALPVLWAVGLSMIVGSIAILRHPGLVRDGGGAGVTDPDGGGPDGRHPEQQRTPAPRTPAFDVPDRSVEVASDQPEKRVG
jgi:hypothetical protein